ncbi:MAG: hypothetical protein HY336_01825 [Candidatus Doudnabacteria bacterium]|nr:hypothetical protein [Candidatus Doudnabacteria bacterium]
MNPVYQPTNLTNSIIALVFYLIMAGFAIYSMLTMYALIRFGKSKLVAFGVCLLYLIISASLYSAAVDNLGLIKF